MEISFKWKHFQKEMILMAVRWYLAYALSYRNIEELMAERGSSVDHATVNRWVVQYAPLLEESFRQRYKKPVGSSWRMDETYIKVKGEWCYLYRAVDKEGQTIDFMLSKNRDREAAEKFLEKAIGCSGLPDKVTIDGSVAKTWPLGYTCQNITNLQGAHEMEISFKWKHFKKEMILMAVRWYIAYALSYRNIEELMAERGSAVDHVTINRWVVQYAPLIEESFRRRHKKPVGSSWRMDETYIKVKGDWHYLYRAVDKEGQTIDFMLSKNRDREAAEKFLEKAIGCSGLPDKVTIDKSGANKAGLEAINVQLEILLMWSGQFFQIRQIKYLNNVVEQDHRAVKRIVNPMMGFKAFQSAEATLAGIELYHMLKKGQHREAANLPVFEQFYALAA